VWKASALRVVPCIMISAALHPERRYIYAFFVLMSKYAAGY
jgi:hypothetical protein